MAQLLARALLAGSASIVVTVTAASAQTVDPGAACRAMRSLALPHVTVTSAEDTPAGSFSAVNVVDGGASTLNAPRRFCRVAATLTPSADSDIKIEVWLPSEGWNQKLIAVGNGAFTGQINYQPMLAPLAKGYVVASTDTGHSGNTGSFALGHPEKTIDFGWRAVHELAVAARKMATTYYASAPRYAYWSGCSAGGRQGLMEAQRFPEDFDGIIAGAPGIDWTGRAAQAVRIASVLESRPAARLSQTDRTRLHDAALAACDAVDGLKDGLIAAPERCTFDPAVVQCNASAAQAGEPGTSAGCLTPEQVATARLIYSPARSAKNSREVAGLLPGSELGWTDLGWTGSARATGLDQFRYIVFADPKWTIANFDVAAGLARADDADAGTINALDPNLKPFFARGGKLIQYHGWSDPQISPANSTAYYQQVARTLGTANLSSSYRLFMAPGMGHCGGGDGPNTFDMLTALERWVEQGQPPDSVVASHATGGRVDRTRPLCPYPQIATYTGSGSIDDAANFSCRMP